MAENQDQSKERFLYPLGKYYGKFTPQNLAFNANLQEFAQRVSYLCNLESNGKISAEETYHEIKNLWKQLKQSKVEFLDQPEPPAGELPPS